MSDVKWIKMSTEVFDNRKIRQIEAMPEGDSIIVIWFKLLCLAGCVNDKGYIYITQEVAYTEQTLAVQFNRPLATVQLALKVLEQFGMIEVIDDILCISNWEKYQSIEKLEKMREQTRIRVAKHRENQKKIECNVTCNADVTQCNVTDKDIDKDIDIDIDIDNNIYIKKNTKEKVDYELISQKFNEVCVSLPSITKLTDKRKRAIDKVFVKERTIDMEEYDKVLNKIESSDFLTGRTGTWRANFDWLMNPNNIAKVIDGNYDNKDSNSKPDNDFGFVNKPIINWDVDTEGLM